MFSRHGFIRDIAITATGMLEQYGKVEAKGDFEGDEGWYIKFTPDGDVSYFIDSAGVERGISKIVQGRVEYHNSGYRESRKRWALLSATDGGEGDYDAIDADCVVQADMFDEIRYG